MIRNHHISHPKHCQKNENIKSLISALLRWAGSRAFDRTQFHRSSLERCRLMAKNGSGEISAVWARGIPLLSRPPARASTSLQRQSLPRAPARLLCKRAGVCFVLLWLCDGHSDLFTCVVLRFTYVCFILSHSGVTEVYYVFIRYYP